MNGHRVPFKGRFGTDGPRDDVAPAVNASGATCSKGPAHEPRIADHAVLRFLERAYGLDLASVKAEMMTGILPAIDFGASVVIVHGVRLIIRDGRTVITALPRRRR
jgi:hypothetical protein